MTAKDEPESSALTAPIAARTSVLATSRETACAAAITAGSMTPRENCCRLPGEPAGSQLKKEAIRLPAYPVRVGRDQSSPILVPSRRRSCRDIIFSWAKAMFISPSRGSRTVTGCSALKMALDPVHPSFTHGGAWPDIMSTEPDLGFHETEWGLVYKAYRKTKEPGYANHREHHLLTPGVSCGGSGGRY